MLPLNARPAIQSHLIDDFLAHGSCRRSERQLRRHFASYAGAEEVSVMARKADEDLKNMMDDCMILIAAAAKRKSILCLIQERVDATELQACRLFAVAELKWSSQRSENLD